jgi:hypothetical protein
MANKKYPPIQKKPKPAVRGPRQAYRAVTRTARPAGKR